MTSKILPMPQSLKVPNKNIIVPKLLVPFNGFYSFFKRLHLTRRNQVPNSPLYYITYVYRRISCTWILTMFVLFCTTTVLCVPQNILKILDCHPWFPNHWAVASLGQNCQPNGNPDGGGLGCYYMVHSISA